MFIDKERKKSSDGFLPHINHSYEDFAIVIEQSLFLTGAVELHGAKNAVLVIMASLILTDGISVLENVPCSTDVINMIELLETLGARINFNMQENRLTVDTTMLTGYIVPPEIMKKMRASVLVMGPLLARFGRAEIALPGGCVIGKRPIDFHLKNFEKMGAVIDIEKEYLCASVQALQSRRLVLEYPSVGATENLLMAATLTAGCTSIINAALEPEVLDLVTILQAMGARITIEAPATLCIEGVASLSPVSHTILSDRLEAGTLLLAAAITKGSLHIKNVNAHHLDVFLYKLEEMGHSIEYKQDGLYFKATNNPKAVSFKTSPFPGFPTDLQSPMMALQCLADGVSEVHETVFENRFLHVRELQKMGAQIEVRGDRATIKGVNELYGASIIASDIRASSALVIAGLAAHGSTHMSGVHHWKRGYDQLETKLSSLGAHISLKKATT